ncbi:MAG: hypothetical protein HRU75_01980 [Planctomycetia bacterium]|nr:MAG: hypothetical protein HRU75_01980 [Planctomycetia bacterium]
MRLVFVTGNDANPQSADPLGHVWVYRFHPCNPSSAYSLSTEADPIVTIELPDSLTCQLVRGPRELIGSTPLILGDDRVIIQSTRRVYCYDFSGINATNACSSSVPQPTICWKYPPEAASDCFRSSNASPTLAAVKTGEGWVYRVFVHGFGRVVALDPDTGDEVDSGATVPCDPAFSMPTIGPVSGGNPDAKFVYATVFAATPIGASCASEFHTLFAFDAANLSTSYSTSVADGPGIPIGAAGVATVYG